MAEQELTPAQKIDQLREHLESMDMAENTRARILQNAQKSISEGSRQSVVADIEKLVSHGKHDENRRLLGGQKLSINISFDDDGSILELRDRVYTLSEKSKNKSKGDKPAGKRYFLVNGTEYDSASAAAREHGIDVGGGSAVRALRRAQEAGQIEFEESYREDDNE